MKTIDAKGKPCPTPVILAKQQIDAGESAFVMLVDNMVAVENLTRLAESQGFAAATAESAGIYAVSFLRGDQPAEVSFPSKTSAVGSDEWVLFVTRAGLGEGDAQLGENLMRMYFYTLTEGENPPAAILFLNGGVKLPTLDEQVVGHLETLAARGVQILVCGTCLNFFRLAEQLRIGTVSNMYELVERMRTSRKVVTL